MHRRPDRTGNPARILPPGARLTEEALRAVNPTSYAEVRAAQDQERARHAVELRRVEKRLDNEREKAAKFQLETTRMRAEVEALTKSHKQTISGLEAKVAAQASDQHAVDMLSSEVTSLKKKLSEAERALAEAGQKAPKTRLPRRSRKNPQKTTAAGCRRPAPCTCDNHRT